MLRGAGTDGRGIAWGYPQGREWGWALSNAETLELFGKPGSQLGYCYERTPFGIASLLLPDGTCVQQPAWPWLPPITHSPVQATTCPG